MIRVVVLFAVLSAALWLAGCANGPARVEVVPVVSEEIDAVLLLVGDAGAPAEPTEPVLVALVRESARYQDRTVVVFLGDNIYPSGLPPPDHDDRDEAERRLGAQIEVIEKSGTRGIFLPGNHDWDWGGDDGWAAIQRQNGFLADRSSSRVTQQPADGCPGPEIVEIGSHVRLVILDTQWWLHTGSKPQHPTSTCEYDSPQEVLDALLAAIDDTSRHVVVAAHHPLVSGGPHGGHFGWLDHVFPLRHAASWLWIPLPLLGSIYPVSRMQGFTDQDVSGSRYQTMRQSLEQVFSEHAPLVYAAGHEHNLQVLTHPLVSYHLISGGGIHDQAMPAFDTDGTLLAVQESGFMRLEVLRDGRILLTVLVVEESGTTRPVFHRQLDVNGSVTGAGHGW
ncbi:metallophosphoesterase [Myxococcota bacterium]